MIQSSRTVVVDELAAALGRSVIRCVRVPDPSATVRGVVMHAPGDPTPDPDLLVLCATPDAEPPACAALVVRESTLASVVARLPDTVAVFAAPDAARWSDVYDRVRWAISESVGQLAEHDAFHLADALATAIGGAVAIEDARRRVVAFSTVPGQRIDDVRRQGILGRQVPEHAEREKWYARLWRNTGVSEFADGTESTARLAIAVRAGAEPLGSIWVVGTREALNLGADQILERSVDVVAACLAHQDHFAARSREARGQVLRQLLGAEAATVGYSLPGPTVLVALGREREDADHELADARMADVLSLYAHRYQGSGFAAVVDGRVYGLLPATDRERLSVQLRGIVSRASLPADSVVVSNVVEQVEQLAAARRQVDRLLGLRGRRAGRQMEVVHVADERGTLLLAELADAIHSVEALRGGALDRLTAHDSDHGSSYVETLRAWFECSGDVTAAAARLHVHANTFRYRMSRARTLFGLCLDDPDERLLLHLQLRLAEFDQP